MSSRQIDRLTPLVVSEDLSSLENKTSARPKSPHFLTASVEGESLISGEENDEIQLFQYAASGNDQLCKRLIVRGCDPNKVDSLGRNLLHIASSNGQMRTVELFTSLNVDLNAVDSNGETPLLAALNNGHVHVASFISNKIGFKSPSHISSDIESIIHNYFVESRGTTSPANKNAKSISSLSEKNINKANERDGRTTLHVAANNDHPEVMEFVLSKVPQDVDVQDNWGSTPLMEATRMGHLEIVKLLVQHKCNVNKVDKWGKTPLSEAVRLGFDEVAEVLRENGAYFMSKADADQPIFGDRKVLFMTLKYVMQHVSILFPEWIFGEVFTPNANRTTLLPCSIYYLATEEGLEGECDVALNETLMEYRNSSVFFIYDFGQGSMGRVWRAQKSEFVSDLDRVEQSLFFRAPLARRAGFKCSVVVPLIHEGTVYAVLSWYSLTHIPFDPNLIIGIESIVSACGGAVMASHQFTNNRESLSRSQYSKAVTTLFAASSLIYLPTHSSTVEIPNYIPPPAMIHRGSTLSSHSILHLSTLSSPSLPSLHLSSSPLSTSIVMALQPLLAGSANNETLYRAISHLLESTLANHLMEAIFPWALGMSSEKQRAVWVTLIVIVKILVLHYDLKKEFNEKKRIEKEKKDHEKNKEEVDIDGIKGINGQKEESLKKEEKDKNNVDIEGDDDDKVWDSEKKKDSFHYNVIRCVKYLHTVTPSSGVSTSIQAQWTDMKDLILLLIARGHIKEAFPFFSLPHISPSPVLLNLYGMQSEIESAWMKYNKRDSFTSLSPTLSLLSASLSSRNIFDILSQRPGSFTPSVAVTEEHNKILAICPLLKTNRLSVELIKQLHSCFTLEDTASGSGVFRSAFAVGLVSSDVYRTFMPYAEIDFALKYLLSEVNLKIDALGVVNKNEDNHWNAFVIAYYFFSSFVYIIHPFEDGNGRTARLITNIICHKCGYPDVLRSNDKTLSLHEFLDKSLEAIERVNEAEKMRRAFYGRR